MEQILYVVYGFLGGAACVGGWWWWINNRAKARAAVKTVENVVNKI